MGADTSGARTSSQGSSFPSLTLTPISACSPSSSLPPHLSSSSSPSSRTMSKKHVYDSSEGLVLKSLRGAVKMNPGIQLHEPSKIVYIRSPTPQTPTPQAQGTTMTPSDSKNTKRQVAVISGGGSGHEPAHAGYVGKGMLAAAVAGDIFASPSAKQILKAIELASSSSDGTEGTEPKDVLAIINNYTGDILNFGLAIEKARIVFPQVNIASVVVADDISLLSHKSNNPLVGPRGLAANILVCKILGALAVHSAGVGLEEVKMYGDAVVANLVSLGVGLEHCHVPGRRKDAPETLTMEQCEIGLGLHNEPGVMKTNLGSVSPGSIDDDTLVDRMVNMLLDSKEGLKVDCRKEGVILFINNLGGMSQLEMGAVVEDVTTRLAQEKVKIRRVYCSSYMTSLNAPGFSISLINVRGFHRALNASISSALKRDLRESLANIELETLLDAPTDALCWVGARTSWDNENNSPFTEHHQLVDNNLTSVERPETTMRKVSSSMLEKCIRRACIHVLQVEKELTEFDTLVGDGDCGETFAAGANAIISRLDKNTLLIENRSYSSIISDLADIIEDTMGGTIGALFAIFLNSLSVSLNVANADQTWREAVDNAKRTLSTYTPAKIGDRTIIDALAPFSDKLRSGEPFAVAVQHAKEGAEKTRGMKASLGRATYSTSSTVNMDDSTSNSSSSRELPLLPPDPGAWGISAILQGLLAGLSE